MRFRNYCIVVMGNTFGVQDEIIKICEGSPNMLDAKGILIATFTSFAEPSELTTWFIENNRNFLVFDLDKENSGFHFLKKEVYDGLFGFLKLVNTSEMNNDFLKTVSMSSHTYKTTDVSLNNKLSQENIEKMTYVERQNLLNQLIDSGLSNLSEEDKKLLPLLVK